MTNAHSRLRTLLVASTLASCGALLTAAGCDTTRAPFTPAPDQVAKNEYPRVVLEQPLSGWVVVSEPVVRSGPGPLSVSVPIRLTSTRPDQFSRVQYRFIFLDSAGVPLRSQSDWRYMRLEPRNQVFLQGNAMDDTAADWRCEIRSAR
ncbi:MAG: YcfL family protein [Phycisphaeraceae bacterium]|nr:YcfL family protein [Phycisphaeraceae bacterium]